MRAVPTVVLLALAATGCMSSSPGTFVRSESATTLRLDYSNDPQQVADTLQSRGCVTRSELSYECPLSNADGQSYAVRVSFVGQAPPSTSYAESLRRRRDGTELAATEPVQQERSVTADGVLIGPPPGESQPSQIPVYSPYAPGAPYSRTERPAFKLRMEAQVVSGASDELTQLGGDAAAALRESLRVLLIQGLPVIDAYYVTLYHHRN